MRAHANRDRGTLNIKVWGASIPLQGKNEIVAFYLTQTDAYIIGIISRNNYCESECGRLNISTMNQDHSIISFNLAFTSTQGGSRVISDAQPSHFRRPAKIETPRNFFFRQSEFDRQSFKRGK